MKLFALKSTELFSFNCTLQWTSFRLHYSLKYNTTIMSPAHILILVVSSCKMYEIKIVKMHIMCNARFFFT